MNAIDGERVNIAARRPQDDQPAVLLVDLAVESEDCGERNFGDAAAANRGDACPAQMFERDRFAIRTNDLFNCRPWNRKMLTCNRDSQRRNNRKGERHA